jgi:DNA polymerase III epsilon subunit-like protein
MRYCFVDVEAGGLDSKVHGITEIAAVSFEFDPRDPFAGQGTEEEFQVLVRPNMKLAYTPYALTLQDRTLQYLDEYGTPEVGAWDVFEAFMHKELGRKGWQGRVVAQYAQFDYGFLSALATRCDRAIILPTEKRVEWICTKNLFRIMSGLGIVTTTKCGMRDIMRWYNIEFEGEEHHALADAKAGVQVFRHMMNSMKRFYEGS